MIEELSDAMALLVANGARVLVLTGKGKAFSSGANLSAIASAPQQEFREYPIPVISGVRGAAAGLGCSIALAADIVVASENAYFVQAFTRVGLIPDGGATYLLARSTGRARAMEMVLLGENIPAAKALEWGLINRVVADTELDEALGCLATDLSQRATVALGLARQKVWSALDDGWAQSLEQEATAQTLAGKTEDFQEGVQAFFARRPACFKGC
jgi:2-(1,2-epoxy-1,2-dihydrophenyl)acetyl-CoA isomerase